MAALAIVAGASIVLFPAEDELVGAPPPAARSSEVSQVTANPSEVGSGRGGGQPGDGGGPLSAAPEGAPSVFGPGSGSLSPFLPPVTRSPAGEQPGREGLGGPETDEDGTAKGKGKAKGKDKPHKGKAKGHDKSHGNGKAKGHEKWHGSSASGGKQKTKPAGVSSSGGKKHGHVAHSGAGKRGGGGHRPHSRPRG
jgi:hypothetical protein